MNEQPHREVLIMTRLRRFGFIALFSVGSAGCPEGLSTPSGGGSTGRPASASCSGADLGLHIREREVRTIKPAGVRVVFSVERCPKGTPITGLTLANGIEVINNETGMPFRSEGRAIPEVQVEDILSYVTLVLDMSFSIVTVEERRQSMIAGARLIVDTLLPDGQTDAPFRPYIAIYAFGSTADSKLEIDFTQDKAQLLKVLERLRDETLGRGSTNLYGAFRTSLGLLGQAGEESAEGIISRTLVILTDGVHETGDAELNAIAAAAELDEAELEKGVESFAILVDAAGSEVDQNAVCALASDPDLDPEGGCFVTDSGNLVGRFESIAERLVDRSQSTYVLGVCSPLEGGTRQLTIRVTRDAPEGPQTADLEVDYEATGFQLTLCDTARVLACRTSGVGC